MEDDDIYAFIYTALARFIREASLNPGPDLCPHTSIAELQLDSLKIVELIFELESYFGIDTDEALLVRIETLSDIAALVKQAGKTHDRTQEPVSRGSAAQ